MAAKKCFCVFTKGFIVDPATISAMLLGAAGVIGAISTWYSSASKNNVDRISTLLEAQDKRITEQQARLTEAYSKIDTQSAALHSAHEKIDTQSDELRDAHRKIDQQTKDLSTANAKLDTQQESLHEANRAIDELQREVKTANRRIRNLQRERDAFHKALSDANVPVPEVVHEEDPSAH